MEFEEIKKGISIFAAVKPHNFYKMKKIFNQKFLVFTLFTSCFFVNTNAQVSYSYDNNGNRTAKVIVLNTLKSDEAVPSEAYDDGISVFEEIIGESSITIYPNPTKGRLRVDIHKESPIDNGFLEIFANTGKSVFKTTTILESNQIDLSNQPQGIYVMRINVDGEITTWKIIKE